MSADVSLGYFQLSKHYYKSGKANKSNRKYKKYKRKYGSA